MNVTRQLQPPRPGYVHQSPAMYGSDVSVLAWFVFMATASAWLPAYNGNIDNGDRWRLIGVYLVIAVIAEVVVRVRVRTRRDALLGSLPALAVLAASTVAGLVVGLSADGRGSPLFLYFGVVLTASWATLVLSTALVSRTRWNRLGLALTVIVAVAGVVIATAQID